MQILALYPQDKSLERLSSIISDNSENLSGWIPVLWHRHTINSWLQTVFCLFVLEIVTEGDLWRIFKLDEFCTLVTHLMIWKYRVWFSCFILYPEDCCVGWVKLLSDPEQDSSSDQSWHLCHYISSLTLCLWFMPTTQQGWLWYITVDTARIYPGR